MVQSSCPNFTEFAHYFCEVLEYGAFFLKFLGSVLSILLFGPCLSFISVVCFSCLWGLLWTGALVGHFQELMKQDFVPFSPNWRSFLFTYYSEWAKPISVSATVLTLTCHDFL